MDYTPDKSSTGLEPNVAAGLAVLFNLVGGLIFFLIEKESKFVKYYAFIGICIGVGWVVNVLSVIPYIGWIIVSILDLALFVVWIIAMVNAFSGKIWKVPILGDIAAKQAGM